MIQRSEETQSALRSVTNVETKLQRIAEKACKEPNFQFTSLYHLVTEELLQVCFEELRGNAAAGIDKMTKGEYEENVVERIKRLTERLQSMKYIPLPVRRVYIPKVGSDKLRPLGIPALEDKIVQAALARILNAIYEQDFVGESYGFRPGRGCHDALRALSQVVEGDGQQINYIVEADIKGFFDRSS